MKTCITFFCLLHIWTLMTMNVATGSPANSSGGIHADRLQTDYRTNPLGIDNPAPRVSWIVASTARGDTQTAYRILVSSSAAQLAMDIGDLWDSRKVSGRQSSGIAYAGMALPSHQTCFWKVMIWDAGGNPGPWSATGTWTMGILRDSDWHAEWVGFDAPREGEHASPLANACWLWTGDEKVPGGSSAPRYFSRVIELPASPGIVKATLVVTGKDRYRFYVNGGEAASFSPSDGSWMTPVRKDVTSLLHGGRNVLYAEGSNSSGEGAGIIAGLQVDMQGGMSTTFVTNEEWSASAMPVAHWQANGPSAAETQRAVNLGPIGMPPWRFLDGSTLILPPPRYLQGVATIAKPVKRAVLYATALGCCDLFMNGKRVSDEYFTPGWTDYAKRVYYRAYDVTPLVRTGANELGAILADGWFSGHIGWGLKRDHYGTRTRLMEQLHVEYADGTRAEFGTDAGWKAWTGALREADFLMGESFDAGLAGGTTFMPEPATGTHRVDVGSDLHPLVQAHPGEPVRVVAELTPANLTEPAAGIYIFDFARNFAGNVRLSVRAAKGTRITLRFGERLNPDGTLYTVNLRGARAIDTYICAGGGTETWTPRFTFHGFQYVEVTGLAQRPDLQMLTGLALSSGLASAGSFTCSDEMLNTLSDNILWTQRANFIDVPTDCPQRDERLGWMGDAQVYCRSASLHSDVQAFFHKWLVDVTDAQRADGQFPMVAPLKVAGDDGGPGWADAGVMCPWTIYEVYGDTLLLEQQYEPMRRFVEFCRHRSTADLLPPAKFHCFGDWLNINDDTPHDVLFTAFFAHAADLVARAATVLGKSADAARYGELFARVKSAFARAYIDSAGRISGNSQTAYALSLSFGLLEARHARLAADHLLENIEAHHRHLTTGFIGTKALMTSLAALGRNDVAFALIHNETFPSWGFTIRNGATSIWERWDGWTPERGFQDPGMNSFAHYSFGAVYEWMVKTIGGIDSDVPGFGHLVIAPDPGPRLTSARVEYQSVNGMIRTAWQKKGSTMSLALDIPANVTAHVVFHGSTGAITESGKPAGQQPGVRMADGSAPGMPACDVGGGHYEFVYTLAK